jgi:hypothetical protein
MKKEFRDSQREVAQKLSNIRNMARTFLQNLGLHKFFASKARPALGGPKPEQTASNNLGLSNSATTGKGRENTKDQ